MPGQTGAITLGETTYRKIVNVYGEGTQSFTVTSGVPSGTGATYSASNMSMKSLSWSVSPGGGPDSYVSVLWENNAVGTTHSTIMNCYGAGSLNYAAMGLATRNNANIPTGNILVVSNLGASGSYTVLMEIGKPYQGVVH